MHPRNTVVCCSPFKHTAMPTVKLFGIYGIRAWVTDELLGTWTYQKANCAEQPQNALNEPANETEITYI